jgi:hypothetical protein
MTILVTDIGNIVWGVTAALTKGPLKVHWPINHAAADSLLLTASLQQCRSSSS